mmetsp:Transcript_6860/g.20289  ORF Transcript_6860/g.20289 Transcript_6860/m.20289 type:complete len:555 (-) Transcript_6860:76-1740(-)
MRTASGVRAVLLAAWALAGTRAFHGSHLPGVIVARGPPSRVQPVRLHGGHSHSHSHDVSSSPINRAATAIVETARAMVNHRWWAASQQESSRSVEDGNTWGRLKHAEDRITVVGALVNIGLSAMKFAAGILGNSAAMLADAAHSTSDLISDAVTFWSVRMGRLPPDEDHPYGHGRFEALGSLLISVMLLGTAWAIGWHSVSCGLSVLAEQSVIAQAAAASASSAHLHAIAAPGPLTLGAALFSLLCKEWLYRATAAIGRNIGSSVVLANAYHHRTDALSSVIAFLGIGGSILGFPLLDPIGGVFVACMVGLAGVEVAFEALNQLTDAVDHNMVQRITDIVESTPGVVDHSDVRVRWSGSKLLVDVCVVVDPTISASAANDVVERVRMSILRSVTVAKEVLVRSTPHTADLGDGSSAQAAGRQGVCPLTVLNRRPRADVERHVKESVRSACPGVMGIEHLTVHYLSYETAVEVAIKVDENLTVRQAKGIAEGCRQVIIERVPEVAMADIHLDLLEESPASMLTSSSSPGKVKALQDMRAADRDAPALGLQGPLRD